MYIYIYVNTKKVAKVLITAKNSCYFSAWKIKFTLFFSWSNVLERVKKATVNLRTLLDLPMKTPSLGGKKPQGWATGIALTRGSDNNLLNPCSHHETCYCETGWNWPLNVIEMEVESHQVRGIFSWPKCIAPRGRYVYTSMDAGFCSSTLPFEPEVTNCHQDIDSWYHS